MLQFGHTTAYVYWYCGCAGLKEGEGSGDEETTLTPISEEENAAAHPYQPSIDFQRFHAVIGEEEERERIVRATHKRSATGSREDRTGARHPCVVDQASQTNEEGSRKQEQVARSQTGSPDLSDANTDVSRLTELSSIPIEAEGGAGQEQTVDSRASSVVMALTGSDQPLAHMQVAGHPLQLARRVPSTRQVDTHDSREMGGSATIAGGGDRDKESEPPNRHRKRDDLQALEEVRVPDSQSRPTASP